MEQWQMAIDLNRRIQRETNAADGDGKSRPERQGDDKGVNDMNSALAAMLATLQQRQLERSMMKNAPRR